jgi:hypothetical protein
LEDKPGYPAIMVQHASADVAEIEIELPENIVPAAHARDRPDPTYVVSNPVFGDAGSGASVSEASEEYHSIGAADTSAEPSLASLSDIGVAAQEENEQQPPQEEPREVVVPESVVPQLLRSERVRRAPTDVYSRYLPDGRSGTLMAIDYTPYAHIIDDPQMLEEVRSRPDVELWERSINNELSSLLSKDVYDIIELLPGHQALPVRFVFKVKCDEKGHVSKYKTKLVAKGYPQKFAENCEVQQRQGYSLSMCSCTPVKRSQRETRSSTHLTTMHGNTHETTETR